MSELSRDERLTSLRNLIEKKISISTSNLVDEMNVSRMTLFRDLETLENEGFIERFHGSVTLARTLYDLDASLAKESKKRRPSLGKRLILYSTTTQYSWGAAQRFLS